MRNAKLEPYKDLTGQWRWKAVAANGKTLADSGEGFKTKAGLRKNMRAMRKLFEHPDVLANAESFLESL